MVLETKLPGHLCICCKGHHPHVQISPTSFTGWLHFQQKRGKCLSLAKTEVDREKGLLEGSIFSHSFTYRK